MRVNLSPGEISLGHSGARGSSSQHGGQGADAARSRWACPRRENQKVIEMNRSLGFLLPEGDISEIEPSSRFTVSTCPRT